MEITIETFNKTKHNRDNFDCGNEPLNDYIKTKLSQDIKKYSNTGYTILNKNKEAIGFFTLSQYSLKNNNTRNNKDGHKTISATLLGLFAIDKKFQGQGMGAKAIYKGVYFKFLESIKIIVSSTLVVHPLSNNRVIRFYENCGFKKLDENEELTMYITTKDITSIVKELNKSN